MQLQFLGEDFDPDDCDRMCDNCKTGLQVGINDMSSVAIKVIQFLDEAECARNNFTMNQAIDLLRGKKVTSKFPINKTIMNDYSGSQK